MSNPIISVRNLQKFYPVYQKEPGFLGSLKSLFNRKYTEVKAVDNISFEIEEGELIGFIGPNGAGKTTTLKVLSGLLYPTLGEVNVLDYKPWERKNEFKKQFALVMGQKNQVWWDLPAIDTFLLYKEIYDISDSTFKKTLAELTELLEVEDILKTPVKKLSLGQRMKMELIASLIHHPKILFLDEPTIGLDVVMQKKVREFIRELNNRKKTTIILTSHYMLDVKELAKRVIIIDHGKILYDGLLSSVIEKFSDIKILTLTFAKPVSKEKLLAFGKIEEFSVEKAVILIKRKDTSTITSKILKELPIEDLNLEEPPIEDIIRQIFSRKSV